MKIKRQSASLRHQVQDVLRDEIVSGRLKPGQRLVEQQLCSAMDVSRTSLREALRRLEAEGLVELVPHRGAVVASVAVEDARQIYEVRRVLEAQAVEHFVASASDEDVAELQIVIDELSACSVDKLSGADLLDIKQRFYHILLDIDENTILRGILDVLNNRVSLLRALSMGRSGRPANTVAELREMAKAISQRDGEAACRATRTHIENAAANVLSLLEQQNPPSSTA
ncbi:GntR family transcriptional regulator [Salinisphaera sp. T31B1]|uniref:GntR family transcriptional regulator n=1 Tax=Salinisphaera sp. T31B1 TaxID=727963 RepID=UPI003341E1C6